MTVWYHLTTIFRRCFFASRHNIFLQLAGVAFVFVALITTIISAAPAFAAPNVTKTIGFQGRLLNAAGVPVPDGSYNVQFKLYEGGTGAETGNPGGALKWTETYINNGSPTGGIPVKNGFLTVDLGEKTPFGTNIDWDNDTIWLSVNVAGNAVACSSFNGTGCEADGEMLPMKRITATPYAINSGAVNGKTANDFTQLGQGVQTDLTDLSSIFINKTGNGNLIQLQNAATDVFTVNNAGNIEFGGNDDHSISLQGSAENTPGRALGISAGSGGAGDGTDGGALTLQGGSAGGTNGNGGDVVLSGGSSTGTGSDGLVIISTPTFKTAEQQDCGVNCTVNQASIDSNGGVLLNATAPGLTFTFGDPKNTTAGRVVYVTAKNTSNPFTLMINGGGVGNTIAMKPNTTASLFWNGSDWTTSSLSTNEDIPLQNGTEGNVQVGSGLDDSNTTLLTLDKSAATPLIVDQSLLGSMYYDTTLGKVQCYEAEGWGDCGDAPDTFISLSPEYANAVKQGSTLGEFNSGICSSDLGINDGTPGQEAICGDAETYNFYSWKSDETTTQTKSIFVTHELPSTFKEFAESATSLTAFTDSADATVSYQFYKKTATGLTPCGTAPTVASTGLQTSWQEVAPATAADPTACDFAPGDSVVIKITFQSKNGASAYASTLRFAFSNK